MHKPISVTRNVVPTPTTHKVIQCSPVGSTQPVRQIASITKVVTQTATGAQISKLVSGPPAVSPNFQTGGGQIVRPSFTSQVVRGATVSPLGQTTQHVVAKPNVQTVRSGAASGAAMPVVQPGQTIGKSYL